MMEAASFGTMGNICNCKELYREEVSAIESQLAASQAHVKELHNVILVNISFLAEHANNARESTSGDKFRNQIDFNKTALTQPTDTAALNALEHSLTDDGLSPNE